MTDTYQLSVLQSLVAFAGAVSLGHVKYKVDRTLELRGDRSLWYFVAGLCLWGVMALVGLVLPTGSAPHQFVRAILSIANDVVLLIGAALLINSPWPLRRLKRPLWPVMIGGGVVAATLILLSIPAFREPVPIAFVSSLVNQPVGLAVWDWPGTILSMGVGIAVLVSLRASFAAYGFNGAWSWLFVLAFALWTIVQPVYLLRSIGTDTPTASWARVASTLQVVSLFGVFVLVTSLNFLSTSWMFFVAIHPRNVSLMVPRPGLCEGISPAPTVAPSATPVDCGHQEPVLLGRALLPLLVPKVQKLDPWEWVAVDTGTSGPELFWSHGRSALDAVATLRSTAEKWGREAPAAQRTFVVPVTSIARLVSK